MKESIQQFGFEKYVTVLSTALEKIDAPTIANMERELAPQYWSLYQQLETGEIEEEPFYAVIKQADQIYYTNSEVFHSLVMAYFLRQYEQVFEITP